MANLINRPCATCPILTSNFVSPDNKIVIYLLSRLHSLTSVEGNHCLLWSVFGCTKFVLYGIGNLDSHLFQFCVINKFSMLDIILPGVV